MGWAGAPSYPTWNLTRPYLTGAFLTDATRGGVGPSKTRPAPPLGQFPLAAQERLLVEDLLWAVTGYESRYVKPVAAASSSSEREGDLLEGAVEFALVGTEGGDASLAAMARKFLPLAAACVRVRRFVEAKRR